MCKDVLAKMVCTLQPHRPLLTIIVGRGPFFVCFEAPHGSTRPECGPRQIILWRRRRQIWRGWRPQKHRNAVQAHVGKALLIIAHLTRFVKIVKLENAQILAWFEIRVTRVLFGLVYVIFRLGVLQIDPNQARPACQVQIR